MTNEKNNDCIGIASFDNILLKKIHALGGKGARGLALTLSQPQNRDGLTIDEISEIMGCKAGSLKQKFFPQLQEIGLLKTRRRGVRNGLRRSIYSLSIAHDPSDVRR